MDTININRKGFTLIELMIVILIIGVLSILSVPRFSTIRDKAKYSQARLYLKALFESLEHFSAEYGAYPPDVYPNMPPPGLVPGYASEWPYRDRDPFNSRYDYEAWPRADGTFWVGIVYYGKNRMRDDGLYEGSYYVTNGIDGLIMEYGDDLFIQAASHGGITLDVVDPSKYRRVNSWCYVLRR